ncbi:DUF3795 domain-containing protein [Clostridioides difficile]|nr:DUF3795 domain-containing protein [Clostridioides difficile]
MKPCENTAAICGLFCGTCPEYPKNCHGCLSDNVNVECSTCDHGFRDCSELNNVTRCYECDKFPCDRLHDFKNKHIVNGICHHKNVINNLQYMKENSVPKWIEKQITENTCPNCNKLIVWFDKDTHKCK